MPNIPMNAFNPYWIGYNNVANYDLNTETAAVVVRSPIVVPTPKRKYKKYSVPGRNGDIIFPTDAYENMTLKVELFIYTNSDNSTALNEMAHKVMNWLTSAKGYAPLTLYGEAGRYDAFFVGGDDTAHDLYRFGRATATFDLKPQCYIGTWHTYNFPVSSPTLTLEGQGGQFAEPTIIIPLSTLRTLSGHDYKYQNPRFVIDIIGDGKTYTSQDMYQYSYSTIISFAEFGNSNNVPPDGYLVIQSAKKRVFVSNQQAPYIYPYLIQNDPPIEWDIVAGVSYTSRGKLRWPLLSGRGNSTISISPASDNYRSDQMSNLTDVIIEEGWWRV